jgi:CBS domain-containing protein
MNKPNQIPDRIADALHQFPPFSMFPKAVVQELAHQARVQILVKDDLIWKEGDPPGDEVLFLARGRVEYYRQVDGQSELVDVRDVGDILGLSALHACEPFRVSAQAVEDSVLYNLSWPKIRALLEENDQARYYVRRHMFWGTRVGRTIPTFGLETKEDGNNTLEAHIKGARVIEVRPLHRLLYCLPDTPIREAAQQMNEKRVPSILIVDGRQHPIGIATNTDLVKRVIIEGNDSSQPISTIMSHPVVTTAPQSSTTATILKMLNERIGQICITEDGTMNTKALDVYTQKDLLSQSGHHPAGILKEIRQAKTPARFREICDDIEDVARSYLEAGISAIILGQICAELFDELVVRLLELASIELSAEGISLPDVSWAWLAVGSDGRKEQILRTDMDNAFVFASTGNVETDEANRKQFLLLTERVVTRMVQAGFSRCQGAIMASNPRWCRTEEEWIKELSNTGIFIAGGDTLLRTLILYDLRYVAGNKPLVEKLRQTVFDTVSSTPAIQRGMAEMVVATPPPVNFWGKFMIEKKGSNEGAFDIKKRGTAPIRDAARVLALTNGLKRNYSTGGRLLELGESDDPMAKIASLANDGYDLLLRIRTLTGFRRGDNGRFIEPDHLTKLERAQLTNVFDVQRMVQDEVRSRFNLEIRL